MRELFAVALLCLITTAAHANGRLPGATGLAIHPTDEQQLLLGLTYGLALTRDGGASWTWMCEQQIEGNGGDVDPSIVVTGDGSLVVLSLTNGGVLVSRNDGCSFERAMGPLQGQRGVDLTLDPSEPGRVLALLSTIIEVVEAGYPRLRNLLAQSLDHGASWEVLAELPDDFSAETVEVAPSDGQRIYVSGTAAADPLQGIVERSDDGGLSWTRTTVELPYGSGSLFVSGIHPNDPDRLWFRVPGRGDIYGVLPAMLWRSTDGAASFDQVGDTQGGMLGFAVSPDGERVVFGGPLDGLFVTPADGSAPASKISDLRVSCVRWYSSGLYVCGLEPGDPYSLGYAADPTEAFVPLWHRANTCREACSPPSPLERNCRQPWENIAPFIGADAALCDGSASIPDAGLDAGLDAGPVVGIEAGSDADDASARSAQSTNGCTVSSARGADPDGLLVPVLMLVSFISLRRSRHGSGMGKRRRFANQARACHLGLCAFAWMSASALTAGGCSDGHDSDESPPLTMAGAGGAAGVGSAGSGGQPSTSPGGQGGQSGLIAQGGQGGAAGMAGAGSGGGGGMGAGDGSVGAAGVMIIEAVCGENDTPEAGLQGDVNAGTVNCGLTLLSEIPFGGHAQGSGHCAYVRLGGGAYMGSDIKAFSLADPLNPVETDTEPAIGGSESMRAQTVDGRAILVSGSGVYDISDCEDMVKKGEIKWPSQNAQLGLFFAALSSHEIAISHDAKRVYSGLGFAVANIENLEQPDSWTVKNWTCEMNVQSDFPQDVPNACEGPTQQDVGRQYSHSSDDNLEGTVWYGANQEGSSSQMEPATARMVDISDPNSIEILDTLHEFPGHSMSWWRTPDGREFIIGANEGLGPADSCVEYPRPKSLGNALDAYIVEVTGNEFGEPFALTLDINKPENCQAAKASGANASITEHNIYNKGGAAFVMIEYGGAGLRVFDLRDGEHPREVAYYNDGKGHVHSGVFDYDAARGIMLASGSQATHVLMLQPQMIAALGLPMPTDPAYPYK